MSNRNHNEDDDDDDDSDADHYTRQCSPQSQQQPPTSTTSANSFQASRQNTFARPGSHETESYGQSYGEASTSSHHQQHHHRSYQSMQEDHVGSSQGSLPRLLTARSMRIENGEEDEDDDEDDHVSSRFVLNEVSNLTVEAMLADAPGERSVDEGFEGRSQPLALSLSHHHHHSVMETDPSDGETVANSISGNVVSEAGGSGLQSEDVLVISGRRTNAGWEQAVARVHDHDTGVHFGRMAVATQSTTATTSKTSSSSLIVSSMQNYVTSSTGCLVESGSSSLGEHSAGLVLDSVVDSTVSARSVVDHEVVGMEGSLVSIVRYTTTDDVSTTVDGSGHLSITSADVEGLNSAMDASSVSIGESSSMDVLRADFSLSDGVNASLSSTLENHQEQHMDITESISLNGLPHSTQRPSSLDQSVKGVWCEECNTLYDNGCLKHRIQTIFDKPVLSRAWASLPGSHLLIEKVGNNLDGVEVFGVFTKKLIPKRTQFGPVEGVLTKKMEGSLMPVVLQLECESGEIIFFDTSDESQSNWMRFVRPATNYCEQNVVVVQHGSSLYYTTVRAIPPKAELKVGYSQPYAERRGLAVLESEDGSKYDDDDGWPCFECSKRFCSSEELQKHLNEHGDGLTVCKVGDVEVHDYREAIDANHVQEVDGDEANIAEIHEIDAVPEAGPSKRRRCKVSVTPIKKSSSKMKSLKKRTLETVDEDGDGQSVHGEFPCNVCSKVFPRPYSLQRHLTMHSGEKKFKCPICEMRFSHVYNRNRHVRRHKARGDTCISESQGRPKSLFRKKHAVNEWICTHCDLTFDNANLLNLHTLTHAAEDVGGLDELGKHESNCGGVAGLMKEESSDEAECLRCPQCTQEFPTKKELINHTSIHGKMRKSFRGLVNPIRPYKCELCYKAFATEERLHRHMLVHGSDDSKPLQCDVCYKRFLNNSALACHIKVHSEEKKYYECPICKEGFDQIIPLKDHIHVHCVDGLYTCPSCQKSFEEYNQIRKHIRAFHSEKKYPCGQCDKIFPRPDKLKLHMLRHSDHREFLCANCGKQFKRKDKLKEHMKRMHSAEREARTSRHRKVASSKKFIPKVSPTDYHRFIYKCHTCLLGFKRRGMLVNHLAKRHPGIRPESVPELNLPILKTTRDYYCQYCEKIYKSSSKRKAHILKQHPGAELPMSNRRKGGIPEIPGMPNPTFSQTVGSITTHPHNCDWCHKQYASKAKLLQHQRKKHQDLLPQVSMSQQLPRVTRDGTSAFLSAARVASNAVILHHEVVSEVEYVTESVVLGSNVKPTLTKDGVVVTTTRPATVFLERESSSPSAGESQVTADAIPTADLLTQAMSELTQNLNDYRSQGTSPSTTSAPPNDQSALSQLLGTYVATSSSSNSEATESEPLDSSMSAPPAQSSATTTTVFVPRTWAGTFEYATR